MNWITDRSLLGTIPVGNRLTPSREIASLLRNRGGAAFIERKPTIGFGPEQIPIPVHRAISARRGFARRSLSQRSLKLDCPILSSNQCKIKKKKKKFLNKNLGANWPSQGTAPRRHGSRGQSRSATRPCSARRGCGGIRPARLVLARGQPAMSRRDMSWRPSWLAPFRPTGCVSLPLFAPYQATGSISLLPLKRKPSPQCRPPRAAYSHSVSRGQPE